MRRILFLVLALAACDQKRSQPPPGSQPSAFGGMTEEEFAALHNLAPDEPVPLAGRDVLVADTRAYLTLPARTGKAMPAVIVIHEWWGLNDHIRHYADRLALSGFAALAVDLYGGNVASTPEQAMAYMKSVDPKMALAVLEAADGYLKDEPTIKAKHRGVIGWCFGGAWALQTALAAHDLDAAVMYYGRPPTDAKTLEPLRTPVLAFFGTQDKSIPKEQVDAFEGALKKLGKDVTIERFDAGHAFANPSGDNYNSAVAQAAWTKTLAFLSAKLGAR